MNWHWSLKRHSLQAARLTLQYNPWIRQRRRRLAARAKVLIEASAD
jgi:hypothetical protein